MKPKLVILACLIALLCVAWIGGALLWPAAAPQSVAALGDEITPVSRDESKTVVAVETSDQREALVQSKSATHVVDRVNDLNGIVLSPDGSPFASARVLVFYSERQGLMIRDASKVEAHDLVAETMSDERGEFALPLPRGRPHQLEVRAEGFAPERRLECYAGERIVLQLQPAATVHGFVLHHPEGTPIAGARLTLRADIGYSYEDVRGKLAEVLTNADGEYRMNGLAPGHFVLAVAPGGGHTTESDVIALEAGQDLEKSFSTSDGRSIRGRVLDDASGVPIEGAEIKLELLARDVLHSDAEGYFTIDGLTPPEFSGEPNLQLLVRASGHALTRVNVRLLEFKVAQPAFDARLPPEICVHGRVIDAEGKPIEGAAVIAFETFPWRKAEMVARSDERGEFVLGGFNAKVEPGSGSDRLLIGKTGYADRLVPWRSKTNRTTPITELGDIQLVSGGFIAGVVLDEQHVCIPGMTIELKIAGGAYAFSTLRRRTDDLGRFAFEGLCAGKNTLEAAWPGSSTPSTLEIKLVDGQRLEGLELVVPRRLSISGIVRDPRGAVVANVWVAAKSEVAIDKSAPACSIATGPDGRFLLQGLEPGRYTLQIHPRSTEESVPDAEKLSPQSMTGIAAGRENLDVRLAAAGLIRGVVLDESGKPAKGGRVSAIDTTNGVVIGASWVSEGGNFHFWLDRAQPWTITATRNVTDKKTHNWGPDPDPTHQARMENVTPGGPDIELKLPVVH